MIKHLVELETKCAELGLEVTLAGKKLRKEDCVAALRAHYMKADGLPYTEVEPMLCFAEWNLKQEEREEAWRSPDWFAQEKLNGCRVILHFIPGKGVYAHSRTVSVKTYRFQELTDQLLFADFKDAPHELVLDCEVRVEKPIDTTGYTAKGTLTKTSLHSTTALLHLEGSQSRKLQVEQDAPLVFHVFDILKYHVHNMQGVPLYMRLDQLGKEMEWLQKTEIGKYFEQVLLVAGNKQGFYENILKSGGEGVILKYKYSHYEPGKRDRDAWIKVKKGLEFDAFVTGFVRGEKKNGWDKYVGALEFSVHTDRGIHQIAACSNFTMEFRKSISVYNERTDSVYLNPAILGMVAEIGGQDVTARVLRLSHATINRWRTSPGDNKNAEDCVVKMADLEAASRWVG